MNDKFSDGSASAYAELPVKPAYLRWTRGDAKLRALINSDPAGTLNALYDRRGEILDYRYEVARKLIAIHGYYVSDELPNGEELAKLTEQIRLLESMSPEAWEAYEAERELEMEQE
jgi:hypothetical protein